MLQALIGDINQIWRIGQARRAALGLLQPLVRRSSARLRSIPPYAWKEPYIIGLLTTLMTVAAVCATKGRLKGSMLGNVQVDCWQHLTGSPNADIGDEILLLSTTRDPEFLSGVEVAVDLLSELGVPTGNSITDGVALQLVAHVSEREDKWSARLVPSQPETHRDQFELRWIAAFDEPISRLRDAHCRLYPNDRS